MNTKQKLTHRNLRLKPLVCLLLPLAIGDLACGAAVASTLHVTNCDDAGSGSLRDAVATAQSGDTVDLQSLACDHIPSAGGALVIAVNDLAFQGPGSTKLTIPSIRHNGVGALSVESLRIGDGDNGIFSSGAVSLIDSLVTGAKHEGVISSTGLLIRNSTVSDNGYTGVLANAGTMTISGSTISGNVSGYCGALAIIDGAAVRIENTTISSNQGAWAGCILATSVAIANSTVAFNSGSPYQGLGGPGGLGLVVNSPQLTLESSIFANNKIADIDVPDSTVVSGHNNLITLGARHFNGAPVILPDTLTADPLLQALADNGGSTMTHALAANSPAIDAGNNLAALSSDQRGSPFLRAAGAKSDIGAFESQAAPQNASAIGPGFTGSWFDPTQSGHGLMLEILPGNRLLAFWFSFNPEGTQQAWFGGVGTYAGHTATITDIALPTGGKWIPNFDASKVVGNPWGTLTFTFTDCNHGKVAFNSTRGYGSGSMDLSRLTLPAGLSCP